MSTNTGIQNEIEIERALDGRNFADLNPTLQAFILDIFSPSQADLDTYIIHAQRTSDTRLKPDLVVKFADATHNISIKVGSGNSVHQEPIEVFTKYLREDLQASDGIIDALLFFHWGDGTLDGSAPVSQRMPARKIIKKYPEKVALIQDFFDQHQDELLERFLSTGIYNLSHVDWIYYGNQATAGWHSIDEVYQILKAQPSHALSVGGLNFQTYGRSLQGRDDKRRQDIQLKWGNMAACFPARYNPPRINRAQLLAKLRNLRRSRGGANG